GPAVHLLIAPLLFMGVLLSGGSFFGETAAVPTSLRDLAPLLFWTNLGLFAFNLIPAFPMDGGRVLRALLGLLMPLERATRIAAFIGQTLAMAFGVFAVVSGQWLLLVLALFVFLGAAQEAAFFRGRAAVIGRRAREAMMTE